MYVYNDEDENPMNDERWEEERARAKDAAEQKRQERIEGLADMLELTGDCRECPHFVELGEGFLDKNGLISNEQLDFLKMQCFLCGGKGTGKPKDERHEKWVDSQWDDLRQWVELSGLKFSCAWCPNVYRVYGQYKDPDDEWEAIEELCCNCKHFGEE